MTNDNKYTKSDRTGSNKGYVVKSRELVFRALKRLKGWQYVADVAKFGKKNYKAPTTAFRGCGRYVYGGWSVFDFNDRTQRALEHWCRQKKVVSREVGAGSWIRKQYKVR